MLFARLLAAYQRRSIRTRLLWLVLVTSLPLFAATAWYIHHEGEMAREASFSKVSLIVRGVETHLNEIMSSHALLLKSVVQEFGRSPPTISKNYSPTQTLRLHEMVRAIGVRDRMGRAVYATTKPVPDSVFLDSQWGRQALKSDDIVISGLEPSHEKAGWSFYMTYPVRDAAGQRTGFAYLELDLAQLNQVVMKNIPGNIIMPVVDSADRVLLRSAQPESFIGTPTPQSIATAVLGKANETFVTQDVMGVPRQYAVATMPVSGWRVFAGQTVEEALGEISSRRNIAIGAGAFIFLLSMSFGWYRSRSISGPIALLAADVRRMAADERVRTQVRGPRELEEAGTALNGLLDQLNRQSQEREAFARHYVTLLKNAREVIFLIDGQGRVVDASIAACSTYGYAEKELLQLTMSDLCADPVTKESIDAEWNAASGKERDLIETRHRRKDGSVFPVEVNSGLVEIDGQNYRQNFVRDISERKTAEAALMASDQFGRATIDAVAAHICVIDAQGVILSVNRPWNAFKTANSERCLARSDNTPDFGVGYNYLEICDGATGAWSEEAAPMAAGIRAVMRGELAEFTLEYPCHSPTEQRWFMVRVTRFAGNTGNCVIIHTNITERKSAELALLRRTRALEALSACNQALITAETEADLLQRVCDAIVHKGEYRMVFVGIAEHDTRKTVRVAAYAGVYDGYLDHQSISWADTPTGQGPTGTAIRKGKTDVSRDFLVDPRLAPWREAALQRGFRSSCALPMTAQGVVIGALTVYSADPDAFVGYELDVLEELSHNLAYGIASIRTAVVRASLEESLVDSEEQFRNLIEQSPIGIHVLLEGVCTYANPRMEEIMGFDSGRMVGLRAKDVVMAESWNDYERAMESLALRSSTGNFSVTVKRLDGTLTTLGIQYVIGKFAGKPAMIGMAQDISERERDKAEIQRYVKSLEKTTEATLEAVSAMVEQRDPYTAGHERRVGELAAAIGKEMGLSDHRIKGLRLAGLVHDVGKIAVPAELLAKPTRLTDIEMALIRVHPKSGYDVLKGIEFPWPIAEVALQHHERLDGSGYPQGLKGDAILLESRIMSVADVVESMSSHRPDRPGLGIDAALAEIDTHQGSRYDPRVVDACKKLFTEKGYSIPT